MNILVVEDEQRLASNIANALRTESFNVSIAHDGLEAEAMLKLGHFDAVVMDIMMPRQDGITTLKHLRETGNSVPVLLLTALSETEDKITGLNIGADDYLTKPFELTELRARVRALLRRPQPQLPDTLQYDTLQIDRVHKTITRADTPIKVSATEYRLLEYLLINREVVVSETELLEHVWDQNYDGISNVVSVYIRYVRNKIDKAFPNETPLLQTVRGLGYKLATTTTTI